MSWIMKIASNKGIRYLLGERASGLMLSEVRALLINPGAIVEPLIGAAAFQA
jgi:hypothetical protein